MTRELSKRIVLSSIWKGKPTRLRDYPKYLDVLREVYKVDDALATGS